jgi:C4-dicarboxylate-specific signal transduction histidine kinase
MTVQTLTGWPIDTSDPTHLAVVRHVAERIAYGDIVRGLVHDLRQPMQSMMIAAQTLLDDADQNTTRSLVDVIRRSSDQSATWIDLLGEVTGERSHSPGPVLIQDVVRWALSCQKVSRLKTDGPISSTFPPDIPAVAAHSRDLATVLTLALNNAKEAVGSHGRGTIDVSATFREKGQGVVISVEDGGSGLPRNDTESPFQPFYTTKSTDNHLGLGLPAAKALLTTYQGKIRLKPGEQGGTRCEVWIPRWERLSPQSS